MREPTLYERILWSIEEHLAGLVRWSVSQPVRFLEAHPKLDGVMFKLFNLQRHWLQAKREWSVGRTMNDGPDDYYLPWKAYWDKVKKSAGYGKDKAND